MREREARTFLGAQLSVSERAVGRPSKVDERRREQLEALVKAYATASSTEKVEIWFTDTECRELCAARGWTELHEAVAAATAAQGAAHKTPPTVDAGGKTYDGANAALMAIYNAWMHVWARDGTHAGWITVAQLVSTANDVLGHTVRISTAARWLAAEKKRYEEGQGVRVKPNLATMIKELQPREGRGGVAEDLIITSEPAQTVFRAELIGRLVERCIPLIDIAGFGADLVSALAQEVYHESLGDAETVIWIPSLRWCYWFMHEKLSLVPRRITSHSTASLEQVWEAICKVALLTNFRWRCKNACTRLTWSLLQLRGTRACATISSWGAMSLGIIFSRLTK